MSNNLNLDSTAGSNDLDLTIVLSVVDAALGLAELVGAAPSATYEALAGLIDPALGLAELAGAVPSAIYEVLPGRVDADLGLAELAGAVPSATYAVLAGRIDTDLGLSELAGAVPVADTSQKHMAPGLILGAGYDFDGTHLLIRIDELQGVSAEEALAADGNWIEILQAIALNSNDYYRSETIYQQVQTVRPMILTDYNARSPTLGAGIKRMATIAFIMKPGSCSPVAEA